MSELLTIDEVARYLKLPKSTLYSWHHRGEGPRPFKLGKHLRYRATEVEEWLESQRQPSPA
jgi:excisionase family DNA binding protein